MMTNMVKTPKDTAGMKLIQIALLSGTALSHVLFLLPVWMMK